MKNYSLIGQAHVTADKIDLTSLDPAFRRATPNMTLASIACGDILKTIPHVPKEDISFILGTHFGEIGSSLEFLKTYNETQVPRPILFQNSLHNSTLGFTTIHLGLTGPAMTVSTADQTAQSMFDLAENMLSQTPLAILCLVDSVPDDIYPHYVSHMPELGRYQNQAYCFLICRPGAEAQHGLKTQEMKWDYFPCST